MGGPRAAVTDPAAESRMVSLAWALDSATRRPDSDVNPPTPSQPKPAARARPFT